MYKTPSRTEYVWYNPFAKTVESPEIKAKRNWETRIINVVAFSILGLFGLGAGVAICFVIRLLVEGNF